MTFEEKKYNLFCVGKDYALVHCISSDYALGAGIAVDFQRRFHLKDKLKENGSGTYPDCIYISHALNNIFNLVTKKKYWNKPTYESLEQSLQLMKAIVVENQIKKIAMPKIGCGLDRLQWPKVREIIKNLFQDTDCEILVCSL